MDVCICTSWLLIVLRFTNNKTFIYYFLNNQTYLRTSWKCAFLNKCSLVLHS